MYNIGNTCVMLTMVHSLINLRLDTRILMRLLGLSGLIGDTKMGICLNMRVGGVNRRFTTKNS